MDKADRSQEAQKAEEQPDVHQAGGDLEDRAYYQANPDYITRRIAGEVVAVPVGEQAKRLNGMVTFSSTGAFLWEQLSTWQTRDELVARMMGEYAGSETEIAAGVDEFLQKAEGSGLVVRRRV